MDMDGQTRRERLIKYVMIGGLILLGVFIIYKVLLKPKATSNAAANSQATTSADSGNTGTTPTYTASDTFVNYNVNAVNSGNTATTSGSQSPITAPTTTTQTTGSSSPIQGPGSAAGGGTVLPPPPPPQVTTPVPSPVPTQPTHNTPAPTPTPTPPPTPAPAFRSYTIVWGDTLSAIAARYHTTWQNLYALNKNTIDSWANAHGNPVPGGAFNNIFPGEQIHVPA